MSHAGIVLHDIGLAPTIGEQADDEFDRETSAPDHRLAGKDRGIENDTARSAFMQTLVQGHGFTPLPQEVSARNAEARVKLGYVNLYPGFRNKG